MIAYFKRRFIMLIYSHPKLEFEMVRSMISDTSFPQLFFHQIWAKVIIQLYSSCYIVRCSLVLYPMIDDMADWHCGKILIIVPYW